MKKVLLIFILIVLIGIFLIACGPAPTVISCKVIDKYHTDSFVETYTDYEYEYIVPNVQYDEIEIGQDWVEE